MDDRPIDLVAESIDAGLPVMDLWVIYPSDRLTSTKARAFVKWFEKVFTAGKSNRGRSS
jgi:hypothetical protein